MERRGEGDVVPTSLMMDPFDRAGYTSKMLRDQHQRTISTEKTVGNQFWVEKCSRFKECGD